MRTVPPEIRRLIMEGVAIVASILLAFGIQAWWDDRGEQERIEAYFAQLTAQVEANAALLGEADSAISRALRSNVAVLAAVGPRSSPLASDSLGYLLESTLRSNPASLQTEAIEAILSQGDLARSVAPNDLKLLLSYRSSVADYARLGSRYDDERQSTVTYLSDVLPLAFLFGSTDPQEDFPLPVEQLLSDQSLENAYVDHQVNLSNLRNGGRLVLSRGEALLEALGPGAI